MARIPFNVPDHALWEEIKKTIRTLPKGRAGKTKKDNHTIIRPPSVGLQQIAVVPRRTISDHAPSPLTQLERRTAQRLGRGQIEPESRIDLHGETLETARFRLLHFVAQRRQIGERLILVITGKGGSPFSGHTLHGHTHFHSPEREGKLRREVPLWFNEAQFRIHIVGFQPAHPRHGGGGAFYVKLRKHSAAIS